MKISLLIISIVVALTGIITTIFSYMKDKSDNPEAEALLGKKIFLYTLVVVVLNSVVPIIKFFEPPPKPPVTKEDIEPLATKEDIAELKRIFSGEKPKNPSPKVVRNEIEKELRAAFKKRENEALDLYKKGYASYDNNQFKDAVSSFSDALKIVETPSFYLARGNSYLVTSDFLLAHQDYETALQSY